MMTITRTPDGLILKHISQIVLTYITSIASFTLLIHNKHSYIYFCVSMPYMGRLLLKHEFSITLSSCELCYVYIRLTYILTSSVPYTGIY